LDIDLGRTLRANVGEFEMKRHWANRPTLTVGIAMIACLLSLATTLDAAEQIPVMRITIKNNDSDHNIYPVITTGTSTSDLWMRAWFGIANDVAKKAEDEGKPIFPRLHNFRIYVNPNGKGIRPGKSVTVTLPLLTQLVKNVTQKANDEVIDWWAGGHVEIFAGPRRGGPPPELTELYKTKPGQTKIDVAKLPGTPTLPTCKGCQPLEFFKDVSGVFKNNVPFQLTEYTLGAVNPKTDEPKGIPTLGTFYGAVDIDVSYVDTAFLPAVMAPINDKDPLINQVGYVGTPKSVDEFSTALDLFLKNFAGWPQFVADDHNTKVPKIASMLHALAGDPDLTPPPWAPIKPLVDQWNKCLAPTMTSELCVKIRAVRDLFQANYDNYKAIFPSYKKKKVCTGKPVVLTTERMISHVYAFSPFVENCANFAAENKLENTPGYKDKMENGQVIPGKFHEVKQDFDDLNYGKFGPFNPYVDFIHNKPYLEAPNVYAYSVDDAVGNLQADGNGFIIAVGGTDGLPNPKPASPPVHVNFGGASAFGEWTHFGVCTTDLKTIKERPVNQDFRSISIYVQEDKLNKCPISLLADLNERHEGVDPVYSFKLNDLNFTYDLPQPPLSPINKATHAPINCNFLKEGTPEKRLCCDIFAYAQKSITRAPDTRNVQVPGLYSVHDVVCPIIPDGGPGGGTQ
jgi:hypothetical protein